MGACPPGVKSQKLMTSHGYCITKKAPARMSLLVHNFFANNNTVIMPQPPYSPEYCNDPLKDGDLQRLKR